MKIPIYSFKDRHQGFISLTLLPNDAIAYRNLTNTLKQDNDFTKNPEDFSLYKVGTFDTESGSVESKVDFMTDFQTIIDQFKQ